MLCWIGRTGIVMQNLLHPLWDAGGVSQLARASMEWVASGRSSLVCVPPRSPPLALLEAELLSRNCTWAVCCDSPQICCLSTAVHPLACVNKCAMLRFKTADFSSPKELTCEIPIIWNNLAASNNNAEMGHRCMEAEDQHEGCAAELYSCSFFS